MYSALNWTYPNLKIYHSRKPPMRGSLRKRLKDALSIGIKRIEVPFDLVRYKNNEYKELNKNVGDIPTKEDFPKLYDVSNFDGDYILHTDPELRPHHKLYWDKREWRKKYLESIVDFIDLIGINPSAIEFHPSVKRRSKGLFHLIPEFFDMFEKHGISSVILIENRRGKYISTVSDMLRFYELLRAILSEKELKLFGFCIDVSQLYNQYKNLYRQRFDSAKLTELLTKELKNLPKKLIKAWHLHFEHRCPSDRDPINWREIIQLIHPEDFCLPEVLGYIKDVKMTINYFENLTSKTF